MKLKLLSFLAFSSTAALVVSIFVSFSKYYPPQSQTRGGGGTLRLRQLEIIPVEGAVGPESFAFDPQGGGPYTGVSDGRILKWLSAERRWTDFAFVSPPNMREECKGTQVVDHEELEHVCGRPLGLGFNDNTGDLYIADAYLGLLMVRSGGGPVTQLHGPEDSYYPLRFTNGLDIDQRTGVIYFTDSSSLYRRRNYISSILSGDRTGRLLKYDPQTNRTEVLLDSLAFPNGVALSRDEESILVAETSSCSILRFCLRTKTFRVLARVPGFPDNIRRSPRGGYWVGIYSRNGKFLDWIVSRPGIGKALLKISEDSVRRMSAVYGKWRGRGMGVRLSEEGQVLEVVESGIGRGIGKEWRSISEVNERGNRVWIGSVNIPSAGVYEILN